MKAIALLAVICIGLAVSLTRGKPGTYVKYADKYILYSKYWIELYCTVRAYSTSILSINWFE